MCIRTKAALLMVLLVITGVMVGACAGMPAELVDIANPAEVQSQGLAANMIDIAPEMVPLTETPAMFTMPMPKASGTVVKKNTKAEIDASNTADGYIMVKYLEKTTKALRIIVKGPSGASYTYVLSANGAYVVLPLSDGNGTYQVGVYENVDGSKYSTAYSVSLEVKLKDEFAPFLRPNQYVNYKADSATVKKAAELTKNSKTITDKIAAVYNYVIKNISYDKDLAAKVQSGYLPDVDTVLQKGKGICFDYAAVMCAMLRSQGVPSKLVVGYTGNVYHAWISAYSKETGWIDNAIYFDGVSWKLMDPTFASSGSNSSEVQKYIGDGKNYTTKYLY